MIIGGDAKIDRLVFAYRVVLGIWVLIMMIGISVYTLTMLRQLISKTPPGSSRYHDLVRLSRLMRSAQIEALIVLICYFIAYRSTNQTFDISLLLESIVRLIQLLAGVQLLWLMGRQAQTVRMEHKDQSHGHTPDASRTHRFKPKASVKMTTPLGSPIGNGPTGGSRYGTHAYGGGVTTAAMGAGILQPTNGTGSGSGNNSHNGGNSHLYQYSRANTGVLSAAPGLASLRSPSATAAGVVLTAWSPPVTPMGGTRQLGTSLDGGGPTGTTPSFPVRALSPPVGVTHSNSHRTLPITQSHVNGTFSQNAASGNGGGFSSPLATYTSMGDSDGQSLLIYHPNNGNGNGNGNASNTGSGSPHDDHDHDVLPAPTTTSGAPATLPGAITNGNGSNGALATLPTTAPPTSTSANKYHATEESVTEL
jgi:hypothetical protein